MGLTPRDLDRMTLWEFRVAIESWKNFHAASPDGDSAPAMSDDRLAELGIEGFS